MASEVVVVVVTVGSRPKRVEPSGLLAEHCVETLRGDGETCPDQTAQATQTGPSESGGHRCGVVGYPMQGPKDSPGGGVRAAAGCRLPHLVTSQALAGA